MRIVIAILMAFLLATVSFADVTFTGSGSGNVLFGQGAGTVTDKIEEGDSRVEVVDTGTGYVSVVTDAGEIARFQTTAFDVQVDLTAVDILSTGDLVFDSLRKVRGYYNETKTVVDPDYMAANINDDFEFVSFNEDIAPSGFKVTAVEVTSDTSCASYLVVFEEWTGTEPPAFSSVIESVTLTSEYNRRVETSAIDDSDIGANNRIYIDLPTTACPGNLAITVEGYYK